MAAGGVAKSFTANLPPPNKIDFSIRSATQKNWLRFKRQWQNYLVASRLSDERQSFQVAVFLTCIGDEANDIIESQCSSPKDRDEVSKLIKILDDHCMGTTNETYESYQFHRRNQKEGESIDNYVMVLRQLAKFCNFKEEDRMIRDRIVIGITDDKTREKLLEQKDLNLQKCVDICRSAESAKIQSSEMSGAEVNKVYKWKKTTQYQKTKSAFKKPCTRCGGKHDLNPRSQSCPAIKAICHKCKKVGHFQKMCRSRKKEIHYVTDTEKYLSSDEESEDEQEIILGTIGRKMETDKWKVNIVLEGKEAILFKIDTGAEVTVIPVEKVPKGMKMENTRRRLYGPGHEEIKVLGKFNASMKHKTIETKQEIFVIEGLNEPLLGRPAIEALNLITRITEVKSNSDNKEADNYRRQYPELFTGLGKLQKEYKIQLKEDVIPHKISTPRRIPVALKKDVEVELKRLQEQDIIKQVTEPTDWCSGLVVVPKANGKIRLCVDLTKLNTGVKRENFPLPLTDELLANLAGGKIFTKLDCNSGFHQMPLAEESQKLTTFITPFGRFCYKRLPFGISSGPELFHREMSQLVDDIQGVICDIDDILITGKNKEEHDLRVRKVLNRLKKAGITLNNKCSFSQEKVKFLGHIVSAQGIEIDPEKIKAINMMADPTNLTELRRFLGMVNHVGKFAPSLTDVTKPLRELLKKECEWVWNKDHQEAITKVKSLMTQAPLLAHYDARRETRVSADASRYGLGAVLLQKEEKEDEWRPVFYASRSLTSTESRYAQIEKEALAATWACEKFAGFLIGLKQFTIETDHKPLLVLLQKKELDELTPRLQRFRMRLMRFSYRVEYVPGKKLCTADTLSRAPLATVDDADKTKEEELSGYVNFVMKSFPATDKRLTEIKEEQDKDKTLSKIKEFCRTAWPAYAKRDDELKRYWTVRHELAINHGILLYGNRLVIPAVLRKEILGRIHEGHQGVVKCRAFARTTVWWPNLSTEIEKMIENCMTCEKTRTVPREPLNPTPTPSYPWQRIGADLFEWKGRTYLLLVDYFSRWIEIALLTKTTTKAVVEHSKSIFAKYGIPEVFISDNGPQFSSREFAEFTENYGITHKTSSPFHPESNGEAERAVRTIKNLLRKASDPYIALLNYRSTPLQQGKSPAELLMGRQLRTKLPVNTDCYKPKWSYLKDFTKRDHQIKQKQKNNYDKRHRAKPLEKLHPGQRVWITKPKYQEAVVTKQVQQPNKKSYIVESPWGQQRRNRFLLRKRDETSTSDCSSDPVPTAVSTLPRPSPRSPETTYNDGTDEGITDELVTSPMSVAASHAQPSASPQQNRTQNNQKLYYQTRSGREVKPPRILNL